MEFLHEGYPKLNLKTIKPKSQRGGTQEGDKYKCDYIGNRGQVCTKDRGLGPGYIPKQEVIDRGRNKHYHSDCWMTVLNGQGRDRRRRSKSRGHLYQVNYGRLWKGEMEGTPWESFLRMTQTNPAPFASWMHVADHGWSVASASPERLIKIEDGTVSTRPIKGTRARGSSEEEDLALRIEMASSTKEMAEHLMLVDLERHDLSIVCKDGTVQWSDCRIEALANVQHLVSGVEGELCDSSNVGMALSSLFPGGSITGCPKLVTMAAIDELEEAPRSAWTGSIGHINFSAGQADWNILIRTMEAHSGPIEWFATVQAGEIGRASCRERV